MNSILGLVSLANFELYLKSCVYIEYLQVNYKKPPPFQPVFGIAVSTHQILNDTSNTLKLSIFTDKTSW